jgi:predicted GH43/DUF377 family glycosyl hydrolase
MLAKEDSEPPLEHEDNEGILLRPRKDRGEIAVLNPALRQGKPPWPFPYRARKLNWGKEYSTIDFTWLETPTIASNESRVLIAPERDYERCGCEDPRISGDFITYIANDGFNATPALAEVDEDFKEVDKKGIIGPNITLEEAIELVDDSFYKELWGIELEHKKIAKQIEGYEGEIRPYNKDASVHRDPNLRKWVYIFRLEPDIQVAFADDWRDFQKREYWREFMRNFSKSIVLRAKKYEKIGLGSPPNEEGISLYHTVEQKDSLTEYKGSFIKFGENYEVTAVLRDHLLKPDGKDILEEPDAYQIMRPTKKVYFPTAMLRYPVFGKTLWLYAGRGDKNIGFRSTDNFWVSDELSHPHNEERP